MMTNRIGWYASHWKYLLRMMKALPGNTAFECCLCTYRGPFGAFGLPPRFDAQCPQCGSLERFRLFKLLAERQQWLRGVNKLVHFAPEVGLSRFLKECVSQYQTADLFAPADLKLDIESIDLPCAHLDAVVCSHVLEHVDDRKALLEVFRVLKPGGILFTMVPLCEGWEQTYENSLITAPKARELHFGQNDHVRYYGRDFSAGFQTQAFVSLPIPLPQKTAYDSVWSEATRCSLAVNQSSLSICQETFE